MMMKMNTRHMGMALLSVMAAACTAVDPDMPENGNPGNLGIPADGSMTVVDYSVSGSGRESSCKGE